MQDPSLGNVVSPRERPDRLARSLWFTNFTLRFRPSSQHIFPIPRIVTYLTASLFTQHWAQFLDLSPHRQGMSLALLLAGTASWGVLGYHPLCCWASLWNKHSWVSCAKSSRRCCSRWYPRRHCGVVVRHTLLEWGRPGSTSQHCPSKSWTSGKSLSLSEPPFATCKIGKIIALASHCPHLPGWWLWELHSVYPQPRVWPVKAQSLFS